uniref:Uncharacterized protein n=1 Tax=Anguilla anguilla TaxID=7936 RepID=A0A0E9SWE2_ANGAN
MLANVCVDIHTQVLQYLLMKSLSSSVFMLKIFLIIKKSPD